MFCSVETRTRRSSGPNKHRLLSAVGIANQPQIRLWPPRRFTARLTSIGQLANAVLESALPSLMK